MGGRENDGRGRPSYGPAAAALITSYEIRLHHVEVVEDAEDAEDIPSYYDIIELDENGEVNLRELVEEEFLLSIPLIPRHELEDCPASADSVWGELPEELEKPNPFDVLKQLK